MIPNKKTSNLLLSIIAFIILVYLVLSYYSNEDRVWIFYNSDNIYVPYLFQDLFLRGGSILQWKFSPVPYFFPDFSIYTVIAALVQNLRVAIVLYAVMQLSLFYVLIVLIGKKITKDSTLFHLSVLISLCLLAGGYLQQETFQYALVSQEHFGTALVFLFGLYLIISTFTSTNRWNYILLFLACFLTTFSDIVFITQFFATAIASLCFMLLISRGENKNIYINNIVVITAGTISSYILYRLRAFCLHITINPHLVRRYHFNELVAATQKIQQNLHDFYQHNAIVVLLLAVFFVITLILIFQLLLNRPKSFENSTVFAVVFLFMSMVMGYFSLLIADNDLMDSGYNGMRHYQPYILFPVFLGIPIYLSVFTNVAAAISKIYGGIILAIISCAWILTPKEPVSNILNFYPPSISCLDQYVQQYQLHNGIANYWESKSYSFLSKHKLNIAAIENNRKTQMLQPELWMNTLHDYVDKDFDFLIIESDHPESADETYVQKAFGSPQRILECPAWEKGRKDKIYVYKNNAINNWMKKELEHPAYF